jgi:Peptidase family M28
MKKSILLAFFLIIFFVFLSIYQLQPPPSVAQNAPAAVFSSGRAMKHLKVIAQKPHPIGSPEHTKVRDYILKELTAMGLSPEVQKTTVVNQRWGPPFVAGTVHNIVAKQSGTDNTKAILVAAHYDSVPNGSGASDDGAAVVAMLETIRALRAGSPLKNDVIFLFTDGEEPGLLGAKAFIDEHPLAKNVGLVLNFEARGNSGPSIMFETSSENGWLIKEFASSAVHPITNSLFYSIYKLLPNDTDLTIFKAAGLPGFNFAYMNGVSYYHTFADNLETIDERSLQHHGNYILNLTRHFGNLNLGNTKKNDAIYFDILGIIIVQYSESWSRFFTIIVMILFGSIIIFGFKKRQLSFSGIFLGFFAFLLTIISTAAIVTLLWWTITSLESNYQSMVQGDTYNSNLYIIAFTSIAIAITSALFVWFHKKISVQNLAVGALLWWLILMIATQLFLPDANYLFTWPLLSALIGLGLIFSYVNDNSFLRKSFAIASTCAIPGIILLTPTIYLIFVALTLEMSGVAIIMLVLLLGLLIPLISLIVAPNKWLLSLASILISLVFLVAGSFTADFNANNPKPNSIFYALNADTGKAIWASADKHPDEWTSQFLSSKTETGVLTEYLPMVSRKYLYSQASAVTLTVPNIELFNKEVNNGIQTLQMRITSPKKARIARISVDSNTKILSATVNGKQIDKHPDKEWGLNYFALPKDGIELTLESLTSPPLKLKVASQIDGLPEIASKYQANRPKYMMPTAFGMGLSDSTLVSKSFTF